MPRPRISPNPSSKPTPTSPGAFLAKFFQLERSTYSRSLRSMMNTMRTGPSSVTSHVLKSMRCALAIDCSGMDLESMAVK